MMHNVQIFVFAKPCRMGLSKTRLAKDIGATHANRLNRFCHSKMVKAIDLPAYTSTLFIAPNAYLSSSNGHIWPTRWNRRSQSNGNLGDRLENAVQKSAPGPVIILGTDAPDVSPSLIRQTVRKLQCHDVVLGPAHDGGFWLLAASHGFKVRHLKFNPVRWSSEHAMADLESLFPKHTRTHYLPTLIDLDDKPSLDLWSASGSDKHKPQ